MKILRNYILKEFFAPLILSFFLLTIVMLLGNLIHLTDLVIRKGINILIVAKVFLYLIPSLFIYTIPISVLVAVLFALGRLASDNEIIAIRASGINVIGAIFSPLLIIGLILSLMLVISNDKVVPWAHFACRKTIFSIAVKNPSALLEPGVFIKSFDKYIIFIYNIKGNKLEQVRIYEPQGEGKRARTIVAKKGEFVTLPDLGIVKLKLTDGTTDEPNPSDPKSFYKLNFKTFFLNLNLAGKQKQDIEKKPKDMTFRELNQKMRQLKKQGIEANVLLSELHRRLALGFSAFVFMLVGLGIGLKVGRREKSINLSIAFLTVGIYYLLLLGAQALSIEGNLPPQIAMWLPNIILGALGLFLIKRICAY